MQAFSHHKGFSLAETLLAIGLLSIATVTPYAEGVEKVGFTEYKYRVFVTDVTNVVTGATLGTGPSGAESLNTKLKRVQAQVEWWGARAARKPR